MIDPIAIILIFKHRRNIYIYVSYEFHTLETLSTPPSYRQRIVLMRAASSDVLLLEILLIPSRIVIFNGFPHRSLFPQFQQRPHFFFYLSLSHPRIIISQLFEELKEEKRKSTVEAQPLQYFYKCISPLLERDKRFFRSMPYLKRANISSTQFI